MIHSNFSYCGSDGFCVLPPNAFTQVLDWHDKSSTVSRSAILVWKSPLQRLFYTAFYAVPLVLGIKSLQEKQYFDITLFENYICQIIPNRPYLSVSIRLGSKELQVYDATLQFTAQLSGFSYYLHYHYWATAIICVGIIFSISLSFTLSILLCVGARAYLQMETTPLGDDLFTKPTRQEDPKKPRRPLVDDDNAFTFGTKKHVSEEDSAEDPPTTGPSTKLVGKTTVNGKGKEEISSPKKPTTEAPKVRPSREGEKKEKGQELGQKKQPKDKTEIHETESSNSDQTDSAEESEIRKRNTVLHDPLPESNLGERLDPSHGKDKPEDKPDKDKKD